MILFLAATVLSMTSQAKVDCSTLTGKVLFGYQGWFRTPNDGSGTGWSHWSHGVPTPETMAVDLYPDLSEFDPKDLCEIPGVTIQGKPAYLFSSYNPNIVNKHFEWMRKYGLDGVLVQRFITDIPRQRRKENDRVLLNIKNAAEKTGRAFAIEYDISGARPETVIEDLKADWNYLVNDLKITKNPQYLFDKKKPVVSIWGPGLNDESHPPSTAAEALALVKFMKTEAKVSLIGGTPGYWRSQTRDTKSSPDWAQFFAQLDTVQPWSVGRYADLRGADVWSKEVLKPDLELLKSRGQNYMPVIFPGFSWHNLNRKSPQNQIPRLGGRFLWRQAKNALDSGAQMLKIAMFDEVNEATAMFKAVSQRDQAPNPGYWLTLDADGENLASDHYLRLAGEITKAMHQRKKLPATMNISD